MSKLTDEQVAAGRERCEARDVSDAKDDANIVSELLQWAASIDADGDDLRPLLRRAAEALTDRMEQIKSAVDGAAKFADRTRALTGRVAELERLLMQWDDAFATGLNEPLVIAQETARAALGRDDP